VTLAQKQLQLVENYSIIDDPQERLAAVVDDARKMPPLPEAERTEANRVKGCISQAWIVGEICDGRCHFRCDADSPLVRGLLKLLCDLYTGGTPAEVISTEPALLEQLDLSQNVSPTRLNGLRSVRAKIREFASIHAA
jgi:cysteine desulfuration protein SufE